MSPYVIYARKSSESEDRQVLSIDSQIREMKQLAARHGVTVAEELTETRSAKAPGRPVFNQLMRRIHKGQVAGVLCWKMDRLARNPYDAGMVLQAQADGKLKQIITSDGVKSADSNDRLLGTFEFALATKFIDDLRANTSRGIREKLSRGWATYLPPLGYLNDRVNRTIIKDQDRFAQVRRMWELLLTGTTSPARILRIANDEWGFRTRKFKRQGDNRLARTTLYDMFANPFYMGLIQLRDGRRYVGAHEPMISREEFERAQVILGRPSRPRPATHDFAFTGIIRCGNCGAGVTAEEHIKPSGRRYVYYRCSHNRTLAERCREPAISESTLVEQLARQLSHLAIPERILAWLKERSVRDLGADRARRQSVRVTLDDAVRSMRREEETLLSLRLRDLVTDEVFTRKRQELGQRRDALEQQLAGSDRPFEEVNETLLKTFDFSARLRETFLAGTRVQRRMILEAVGLNYTLRARKVAFSLAKPFTFLAEASAIANWYRIPDDLRTWYLSKTDYFKLPDLSSGSLSP